MGDSTLVVAGVDVTIAVGHVAEAKEAEVDECLGLTGEDAAEPRGSMTETELFLMPVVLMGTGGASAPTM